MAKKDAKATAKTEATTKNDTETKPTADQIRIMDVVKVVGREGYQAAFQAAERALSDVMEGDTEISRLTSLIEVKKVGNTTILLNLSKECVKQSAKNGKPRLKIAADLFRVVCQQAEIRATDAFRKKYPERKEEPFTKVVPSWFTIKSDFARAMDHNLNPEKAKDGTGFRNQWQQWKKDHPEALTNRGSAQQTKSKEQASTKELKKAADEGADGFTANLKASLTKMVKFCAKLPKSQQDEAANRIDELLATFQKDFASEPKEETKASGRASRTAAPPAREAEKPPVNAEA